MSRATKDGFWWKLAALAAIAAALIGFLLWPIPGLEMTVTLPPIGPAEPVAVETDPHTAWITAAGSVALLLLAADLWLLWLLIRRRLRTRATGEVFR